MLRFGELCGITLIAVLLCAGATACHRDRVIGEVEITGGDVSPAAFAFLYEDLTHPLLKKLRLNERLEGIVVEGREFETFVALREWARAQWNDRSRDENNEPYMNALLILDGIRTGKLEGGFCGEYATVFVQACLALGHQARVISIRSKAGSGHRTSEVWSNEYDKWMLMDPFYDIHFERGGVPLNAVELHEILVGNAPRGDLAIIGGRSWGEEWGLEEMLSLYHDVTVIMRNNHLSLMDPSINRLSLGLRDRHTDGRPGFSRWTTEAASDLNWKVNQTALSVSAMDPRKGTVVVAVAANMPQLAGLEAKTDTLDWRPVGPSIEWSLHEGRNSLHVRGKNVRGVAGPPSSITLSYF